MADLTLHTTIEPRGPAAAIVLTDEQVSRLGPTKTLPVVVTLGGTTARLRVAKMGGENLIGLSKANRALLGVEAGDQVEVTIAADTEERTVEVPPELAEALSSDPTVRQAWDTLSYSRRKEMARTIAEAKKPETRDRRLGKVLAQLQDG